MISPDQQVEQPPRLFVGELELYYQPSGIGRRLAPSPSFDDNPAATIELRRNAADERTGEETASGPI